MDIIYYKMRKILTIIGGENAVGYFRFLMPVNYINQNMDYEKIETIFLNNVRFDTDYIYKFDVVHFHANALQNKLFRDNILSLQDNGTKLIMDCDDYWELPKTSPYYEVHKVKDYIYNFLPAVDAITTTTTLFRAYLRQFNKNVYVLPNAIDKSLKQYENKQQKHSRLRIGLIGGASHLYDLKSMEGFTRYLTEELKNDVQIVLCGFDTKGMDRPEYSIWNEFEQILTDDYRTISKDHMKYLCNYIDGEYPIEEAYRRYWAKDIYNYATLYNNIDVLIAPIEDNKFNKMKSELKSIEAGIMGKAIIASNVGINKLVLKHNENALLVDTKSGPEGWAKAIKRLLNDKELLNKITNNLSNTVETKYNMEEIANNRLELYKNI